MNEPVQARVIARRFGLGHNSLRRGSDRLETAVLWLALLTSLILLPVAAAIGTSVYETDVRGSAELRATGTQVVAHTLEAAPITPSATVVVSHPVRAAWTDARGVEHQGVVRVSQGTRAGSDLPIWLDATGTPTEMGPGGATSATVATIAGLGAYVGGLATVWFVVWLVRVALDRWRRHRWQVEWEHLSGAWCRC